MVLSTIAANETKQTAIVVVAATHVVGYRVSSSLETSFPVNTGLRCICVVPAFDPWPTSAASVAEVAVAVLDSVEEVTSLVCSDEYVEEDGKAARSCLD